jgi:hypothetical protein
MLYEAYTAPGLPYGVVRDRGRDDDNHGVIFMA